MKVLTTTGLTELITKIKSSFIKTTDVVSASTIDIDSTPTSASSNLVTSGGVYTALSDKVDDVQINGTSILSSGVANIPYASSSNAGAVKPSEIRGININSSGELLVSSASASEVALKTSAYKPIVPATIDKAVMEGLGNNSLTWSDAYKTSARNTIGAGVVDDVTVNGTSVVSDGTAALTVTDNVTSTSATDALSANMGKSLQDQITNLKNIGRFLAIWNCATGMPYTNPTTLPYAYKTGDYYRVGNFSNGYFHNIYYYGDTMQGGAGDIAFEFANSVSTEYSSYDDILDVLTEQGYTSLSNALSASGTISYAGESGTYTKNIDKVYTSDNLHLYLVEGSEQFDALNGVSGTSTLVDSVSGGYTNYKPNGSSYTGSASTTVETEDVKIGWVYYYDGATWKAQTSGSEGTVQDVQIDGTTILDGSGVANIPVSSNSVSGVMTAAQYTKLNGIEAGAEVNDVTDVQVNGSSILSSGVANVPTANTTTYGVIKASDAYAFGVDLGTGVPLAVTKGYSSYTSGENNMFIGKSTLENVLYNETVRIDSATSLTDVQKAQARSNIDCPSVITITFKE